MQVINLPEPQKGLREDWKWLGDSRLVGQSKALQQILNHTCVHSDKVGHENIYS